MEGIRTQEIFSAGSSILKSGNDVKVIRQYGMISDSWFREEEDCLIVSLKHDLENLKINHSVLFQGVNLTILLNGEMEKLLSYKLSFYKEITSRGVHFSSKLSRDHMIERISNASITLGEQSFGYTIEKFPDARLELRIYGLTKNAEVGVLLKGLERFEYERDNDIKIGRK